MEEKNKLFRQESIDRISSPEELKDYIKVAEPGIWLLLIAIIIFMAGMIYWSCTAQVETRIKGVVNSEMGVTNAYVRENDRGSIEVGMEVECDGDNQTYYVEEISDQALEAADVLSDYQQYVGGIQEGEWVYSIKLDKDAPEGVRAAHVVIDAESPLKFIFG